MYYTNTSYTYVALPTQNYQVFEENQLEKKSYSVAAPIQHWRSIGQLGPVSDLCIRDTGVVEI